MIVYDLQCEQRHNFEAWFASSTAFEDQRAAGQLACPFCASSRVEKAVMAPRITAKSSSGSMSDVMIPKLAALQKKMLEGSTWVGSNFAQQARAMHDGVVEQATIHGSATRAETKALHDEGVGVTPLIFPVIPPEKVN